MALWVEISGLVLAMSQLTASSTGFVETDVDQLSINDGASITGPINNRSANQAFVAPGATAPEVNWEKVTQEQTVAENQGPTVGSILLSIITKLAFILVIWVLITFMTKEFNANTPVMAKKHILASLGIGAGFFLHLTTVTDCFIYYLCTIWFCHDLWDHRPGDFGNAGGRSGLIKTADPLL